MADPLTAEREAHELLDEIAGLNATPIVVRLADCVRRLLAELDETRELLEQAEVDTERKVNADMRQRLEEAVARAEAADDHARRETTIAGNATERANQAEQRAVRAETALRERERERETCFWCECCHAHAPLSEGEPAAASEPEPDA